MTRILRLIIMGGKTIEGSRFVSTDTLSRRLYSVYRKPWEVVWKKGVMGRDRGRG